MNKIISFPVLIYMMVNNLAASHESSQVLDSGDYCPRTADWRKFKKLVQAGYFLEDDEELTLKDKLEKRESLFKKNALAVDAILKRQPDFIDQVIVDSVIDDVPFDDAIKNLSIAYAIMYHNNPLFDILMRHKPKLSQKIKFYDLPLAHLAAHYGNLYALKKIDQIYPDAEMIEDAGNTTSIHQLFLSHDEILNRLLEDPEKNKNAILNTIMSKKLLKEKKSWINQQDKAGRTPLHLIVLNGSNESLKIFLNRAKEEGYAIDFSLKDSNGCTAFDYALKAKDISKIQVLYDAGYNPKFDKDAISRLVIGDTQDLNLNNLLFKAVQDCPHVSIIELLVASGANIHAVCNYSKHTLLHEAALWGDADNVRCLVRLGANINAVNSSGGTPLYGVPNNLDCIKLLLSLGADRNIATSEGCLPLGHALFFAACNREVGVDGLQYLVEQGAIVDARQSFDKSTALHAAVGSKNLAKVRWLVAHGADINAVDKNNETPLFKATKYSVNLDCIKLLLSLGADRNIANNNHWLPLDAALCSAVLSKEVNIEGLQYLLDQGAKIRAKPRSCTVLHIAAGEGDLDKMRWLVAHGADINAVDNDNQTPLFKTAARYLFNLECIKLLLALGADRNIATSGGELPLDRALIWVAENKEINVGALQYLVDQGANVHTKSLTLEHTVLHMAAQSGDLDKVKCLVVHGAVINVVDKFGNTPLKLAQDKNHTAVVDFLRSIKG